MNGADGRGPVQASQILRNLGLSEEIVRTHDLRPPPVGETITGGESFATVRRDAAPPTGLFYRLDVEGLGRDLHALLAPCVVGYSLQLRRNGRVLLSRQYQDAKTPANGVLKWTADVRMHVASVSKLVTAMAMTKLLRDRGVSPDARIADWLPTYWRIGHHADRITFRHLLTHTSGLNFRGDITPADFLFMKHQITQGTTDLGKFMYRNVNYGLCRVLISTLSGAVPTSIRFDVPGLPDLTDPFWDVTSIQAHQRYVTDNVFTPAGVAPPALVYRDADALGYALPPAVGWSEADASTLSGSAGWHLSTAELLAVMGAFRRGGAILSPAQAQAMLDDEFGLDRDKFPQDTQLGRVYAKGGFWGGPGGQIQQSNAFFLPKGMELVILANSPFCKPNTGFMGEVFRTINENIRFDLRSIVAGIVAFAAGRVTRDRARRLPR